MWVHQRQFSVASLGRGCVIGLTVSHYRVTGRLGVGGMGIVYEAEDTRLPRRVALKFLSDELAGDPDAKRRLTREAHTIALLSHPNICTIYEIEESEGRPFLVMELLPGLNLKALMAKRTLETREIVDISVQVAQALEAAHAKNIVHRDIKPGNIVVSERGEVKVLDFGLARRFAAVDSAVPAADGSTGSTIPGRPIGTASYMAPERIMQLPLDGRCDLFSLGVMMYEMATGRLPFTGASPSETATNILERDPVPLITLSPDRPPQFALIVHRLMAKRVEDRVQSAAELRAELLTLKTNAKPRFFDRLRRRSSP